MTDNFDNLRKYLEVIGKLPETNPHGKNDKYYVIELMRRGKDNPDLPAANVHFKNYYITCLGDFDKYSGEIKQLCTLLRLRAYMSVNYKSFHQVMLDTAAEYTRRIATHDYKKPYSIYESCSGSYVDSGDGKWIIDVDREDWMTDEEFYDYVGVIRGIINLCMSNHKVNGSNILWENPSMTGYHFITVGFKRTSGNLPDPGCWETQMGLVLKHLRVKSDVRIMEMIHENHITLLYENLWNG